MQDLSSLTRDQTHAPTVEVQTFHHWTARKVPTSPHLYCRYCSLTSIHRRQMGLSLGPLFRSIHLYVYLPVGITVYYSVTLCANTGGWYSEPPTWIFFLKNGLALFRFSWNSTFQVLYSALLDMEVPQFAYALSPEDILIAVRFRHG